MAMAISNDQLGVVYRRKICIYRITSEGVHLLHVHRPGFSADFASMAVHPSTGTTAAPTFVLALTATDWIGVYQVAEDSAADGNPFFRVWEYRASPDGKIDLYYPHLSDTGSVLSWIAIPHDLDVSCRATFCYVTLPTLAGQHGEDKQDGVSAHPDADYAVEDEQLPALYWESSYDFNEKSGLGVFGNPFGELVVCEVRPPSPLRLDKRLPVLPRLSKHDSLAPSVRVFAIAIRHIGLERRSSVGS